MAGTNAAAVKVALVTALRASAAAAMAGVTVAYSQASQRTIPREQISLGQAKFVHTRAGTHGGTRRTRNETLQVEILVQVRQLGAAPETADLRAVAIGTVIEELFADTPALSGVPSGLYGVIDGGDLAHVVDDEGVYSQLAYTLTFTSYKIQ